MHSNGCLDLSVNILISYVDIVRNVQLPTVVYPLTGLVFYFSYSPICHEQDLH